MTRKTEVFRRSWLAPMAPWHHGKGGDDHVVIYSVRLSGGRMSLRRFTYDHVWETLNWI